MALTAGTKLGPYEIQSPLGAGGMGEVYRARDTRLDRTVAVKILPAHLSANPEAKQRFEREAKAISSLNHPNICHLYDVGAQDGVDFLVMEYLEGETLADRLKKGPLPLDQLLRCGTEIADGLDKAHRSGVVHRDLKPGNIMLAKTGAKLMDFGLAKAGAVSTASHPDAGLTQSLSPTLGNPTAPLTAQGRIVGTFQYMSPEQVEGKEADARSDIFSLGAVLYEMATGKRAFEGKSAASAMAAVLERDPAPISSVQPTSPAALERIIKKCMLKDVDKRWQSAADLASELAWIAEGGATVGIQSPVQDRSPSQRRRELFLAIVAVVALAALGATLWFRSEPAGRVTRTTIVPPADTQFALLNRNGPAALSPDGTQLAFTASRGGTSSLWVRPLDRSNATELPGTEGAYFPFWSPDGTKLGYFQGGKLWSTDLRGGSPVSIADAPNARGGTWGSGGTILFAPSSSTAIYRVSANGGAAAEVSPRPKQNLESCRWPFFLPDGKHFLYLWSPIGSGDERNEIHFASVDGAVNKIVLTGYYYDPQYASGWLLVAHRGTLMAQKMDPSAGTLSGEVLQVSDRAGFDDLVGISVFSASENGLLVYEEGTSRGGEVHVFVDGAGKLIRQISEPNTYGGMRLSADDARLAVPVGGSGNSSVWIWNLLAGTRARFTLEGSRYVDQAMWSRDGRTIYFASTPDNGPIQIYRKPADGSGEQEMVIKTETEAWADDISSDGKWLLYAEAARGNTARAALKALPLQGGGKPVPVVEEIDAPSNARLLPGPNQWLAYQASTSGRPEVYLMRFPGGGARYQVSRSGGTQPVWSKDGRRLYFLDSAQKLVEVEIQAKQDSVSMGEPKTLFQTHVRSSIGGGGYDVTRDGKFLLTNSVTESAVPLTLVTNWDKELKKK